MLIKHRPYWPVSPAKVEKLKGWTYMGPWAVKTKGGQWTDRPIEVYYDPNPDTSKGHTHYPGYYFIGEQLYITDASSAFSAHITGIVRNGMVYVSRYRHDFTGEGGEAIDGGRDYTKLVGNPLVVPVNVDGPMFSVNGHVLDVVVDDPYEHEEANNASA